MVSICDKSLLLQNSIKVSLGLLESQLTNQLESFRQNKAEDENVEDEAENVLQERFDQTLQSLREAEDEMKGYLKDLKADIDSQNIKVTAKDGVIEELMKNEKMTNDVLKSLQSELGVLKSLSNYSSINAGVMAKFRECAKLESEMQEKERIINRLNNVIDEYRAQEDFA